MDTPLNDIILNPTMLENLYGHSLVEMLSNAHTPATKPLLKFLGNNAKKVTVLVNNPEQTFLPEDQLSFLNKLLLACKMNTGDVAILNLANGAVIDEVIAQLNPEKIIAFGVLIDGPNAPLLTICQFQLASLLNAPGLGDLVKESDEAKLLKGKLWACLKTLFAIV
jgi:hypothetical protein